MSQWYILSYDIKDVKRLARFHYHLSKLAIAVQNSVFIMDMDQSQLKKVKKCVHKYCNDKHDDVRLYPIVSPARLWPAGKQMNRMGGMYTEKNEVIPAYQRILKLLKTKIF